MRSNRHGPFWMNAGRVVFDFATGIKTIELADGSIHEELFEAEPVAQLALSTVPHAPTLIDPVATGSVPAPR